MVFGHSSLPDHFEQVSGGVVLTSDQRPTAHDQPSVRRMKTYTGGQGYVYQYYFVGKRPAGNASTEYIFDVTSDRKTTFSVSIFLPAESLADWTRVHGRSLTDAEQYAAVKMRLFRGFDEIEGMMANGRELWLDAAAVQDLLSTLGVT